MNKIIRQTVVINAAPKKVYNALINERKHAKFSGEPATISRKVGGAFSCYGGYVTGINLDLVPTKRIVQAWRSKTWPAGTYSIASFVLSRKAGGRTQLAFTHVGVPAFDFKDISQGWRTFYWNPIKAYLKK